MYHAANIKTISSSKVLSVLPIGPKATLAISIRPFLLDIGFRRRLAFDRELSAKFQLHDCCRMRHRCNFQAKLTLLETVRIFWEFQRLSAGNFSQKSQKKGPEKKFSAQISQRCCCFSEKGKLVYERVASNSEVRSAKTEFMSLFACKGSNLTGALGLFDYGLSERKFHLKN